METCLPPDLAEIVVSYFIQSKRLRADLGYIIDADAFFLWDQHKTVPRNIFDIAARTGSVYAMQRLLHEGFHNKYYGETIATSAALAGKVELLQWILKHTDTSRPTYFTLHECFKAGRFAVFDLLCEGRQTDKWDDKALENTYSSASYGVNVEHFVSMLWHVSHDPYWWLHAIPFKPDNKSRIARYVATHFPFLCHIWLYAFDTPKRQIWRCRY